MSSKHPDTKTISDWYNRRYASGQEQAFGRPIEEYYDRLQKIPLQPNQRILDIACGQGFFLKVAQEQGHSTWGVDISAVAIDITRRVTPETHAVNASGQTLPFPDNSFDVVTCWGSLEHHPDMELALSEFVRVARSQSIMFLRVPNRDFWLYQLMSKLGMKGGTEQQDIIEHLLSLEEWKNLFTQAGLSIEQITPDNWFLKQSFNMQPGFQTNLKLLVRKFALRVSPLNKTYCFDFLCRVNKA